MGGRVAKRQSLVLFIKVVVWRLLLCVHVFSMRFLEMALADGGLDLEVLIPTMSRGGDAVEDVVGTSPTIPQEEVAIKEALVAVSHDVVLL